MTELRVKDIVLEKGRPKVAVPITAENPADIIAECEAIRELPCDMIEWRADYYLSAVADVDTWLEDKNAYLDIIKILDDMEFIAAGKPVIFTVRSLTQGGMVQLTKVQLESIYGIVARSGLADFVDIELYDKEGKLHEEWIKQQIDLVHDFGCRVILSHHDFDIMPIAENIVDTVKIMYEIGADICKLAAMAVSEKETRRLLKASAYLDRQGIGPMIMIAMGEHGEAARVAGGKYGSVITFAAASAASAPGQPNVFTMKKWLDDYYGER